MSKHLVTASLTERSREIEAIDHDAWHCRRTSIGLRHSQKALLVAFLAPVRLKWRAGCTPVRQPSTAAEESPRPCQLLDGGLPACPALASEERMCRRNAPHNLWLSKPTVAQAAVHQPCWTQCAAASKPKGLPCTAKLQEKPQES